METITDPRPVFGRSVATARDVIAAVRPDQLGEPTPCGDYDVAGMLTHVVAVMDRIAILAQGGNPFAFEPRQIEPGGFLAAFDDAAATGRQAWADDAVLAQPSPLPWVPGTLADALASYVAELTLHTWDLARATGQAPAWDDEAVAMGDAALRRALPDGEGRHQLFAPMRANLPPHLADAPDPFEDAVAVAGDAAPIDRLVAWSGRQP